MGLIKDIIINSVDFRGKPLPQDVQDFIHQERVAGRVEPYELSEDMEDIIDSLSAYLTFYMQLIAFVCS